MAKTLRNRSTFDAMNDSNPFDSLLLNPGGWSTLKFNAEIVEDMLRYRPAPPERLYHYTTLDSLLNISKSKNLWLSHASLMNDKNELRHAREIIIDAAKSLIRITENKDSRELLEYFTHHDPSIDDEYDHFIFSFCESPDLLSQWRGYTTAADGLCIGFESRNLNFDLYPIDYDEFNQRDKVLKIFKKMIDVFEDIFNYGELNFDQKSSYMKAAKEFLYEYLERLTVTFKSSSFREENEWRAVVALRKGMSNNPINYRVKRSSVFSNAVLTSYVEMPICQDKDELPIVEIILHPGMSRSGAVSKPIADMLLGCGADQVHIHCSNIELQ
jgi:hypothetical protein